MKTKSWMRGVLAACLGSGLALGVALAEPLVKMDGGKAKPGVVTAWSGSGKKVELTLEDGADAGAVAAAIEANVERVRCKVRGGKVLVIGKTQDDLLAAIAKVELGDGGGDLDLLASAAADESFDSGSSLRAKKTAELSKLLKDRATVAEGKVVAVQTGKFPAVRVQVRILRGPTGALGKDVRKGKTLTFEPKMAMKGGAPDLSDVPTQTNLGANYLEAGDRVKIKVGAAKKGDLYEAILITR
jgi:hypothetical protein